MNVALFVTCIVNHSRPSIGHAAIKLLEAAGCTVHVPEQQSCCGQPAYNSGDDQGASVLATQVIDVFEAYDYVVLPSGSCAATIIYDAPDMLADNTAYAQRAQALAAKTWELSRFLVEVCKYTPEPTQLNAQFTYHDSCSGFRKLGIYQQPRTLLESVKGFSYHAMPNSSECCGFGGLFSVKYGAISHAIGSEKIDHAETTQADYVIGGDWGCLMHLSGAIHKQGRALKVYHFAEILAGELDD